MYVLNLDAYGCCHDMSMDALVYLCSLCLLLSFMHNLFPPAFCCHFSPNPLFSRMALGTRGQVGGNPPPPPEPSMVQVMRLMLEDREAARAEHQANLATLQHLA
jgi:hypothetical protein